MSVLFYFIIKFFIITFVVKLHRESSDSRDWRDFVSSFNRKYLELRSESLLWKHGASGYPFNTKLIKFLLWNSVREGKLKIRWEKSLNLLSVPGYDRLYIHYRDWHYTQSTCIIRFVKSLMLLPHCKLSALLSHGPERSEA